MPLELWDAQLQRMVSHSPVLISFEGDTPFVGSGSESVGHSAKRACRVCAHMGAVRPGTSTVRWTAYGVKVSRSLPRKRTPAAVTRSAWSEPTPVNAWDDRLKWCECPCI